MNYITCIVSIALCSFFLEQGVAGLFGFCGWGGLFGGGGKEKAPSKSEFDKFIAAYKGCCSRTQEIFICSDAAQTAIANWPNGRRRQVLTVWSEQQKILRGQKDSPDSPKFALKAIVPKIFGRLSRSAMNYLLFGAFGITVDTQLQLLIELQLKEGDDDAAIQQKFDTMVTARYEDWYSKSTTMQHYRAWYDIDHQSSVMAEILFVKYQSEMDNKPADIRTLDFAYKKGIQIFGVACMETKYVKLFELYDYEIYEFSKYVNVKANKDLIKMEDIRSEYQRLFIEYAHAKYEAIK